MLCISRRMLVATRMRDGHVSWKVYLMANLLPINCQITSESEHPCLLFLVICISVACFGGARRPPWSLSRGEQIFILGRKRSCTWFFVMMTDFNFFLSSSAIRPECYYLTAILRRQYSIVLAASWKMIYSLSGGVAERQSPIWRIIFFSRKGRLKRNDIKNWESWYWTYLRSSMQRKL